MTGVSDSGKLVFNTIYWGSGYTCPLQWHLMIATRCAFLTALLSWSVATPADARPQTAPVKTSANEAAARTALQNDSQIETSQDAPENTAEESDETSTPKLTPGLVPTLVAVVPGILVHGAGHYAGGDKKTALQLLKWQAVGLGLGAAAATFLRFSGGSRYGNELTIPMAVSGAGLIINTFVADLYGSAGGAKTLGFKKRAMHSATLGYAYIYDPQFSYRHFSRATARFDYQSIRLQPLLWTAVDDDNQRGRLPLRYQFWSNESGEYFAATTAFTYHHFGTESFSTYLGELSLGARIEMRRLGDSLRGSFTTMSVGGGLQTTSYDVDGVGSDQIGLLLGRFGYGFYLPKSGELEGYYEHRRDTFTAGSSPSSRNGSGFLGHFGLRLRQPINQRFAIQALAEIGSAYLITTGLEVQWGQQQ